jgi:S1-C subfamily serine protease
MRRLVLIVFVIFMSLASRTTAQDLVPGEMLSRTIFIKAGNEAGTAFSIDYEGKMYLVTARHVVSDLPRENATIQIWQQEQWKDYHTVKTIFPSSNDVDIAVFETSEKVEKPYAVTVGEESGAYMGQQVFFLGYPFGIASRFQNSNVAPFIKRGTLSAIDAKNPDAVVIYVDGFNNPGFSGGPILYWDLDKHIFHILGVIQGYKEDSAKVLINGQHVNTQLLVNTGILVGYDIKHALKAIKDRQTQGKTK